MGVSKFNSHGPERWTEARVEQLLLLVFRTPATEPSPPPARGAACWFVAACAALLLALPLSVWMGGRTSEHPAPQAANHSASEDLVVAEADSSDDDISREIEDGPAASEVPADAEPPEDTHEAAST
jgi:hypothetical protein